MISSLSPQSQQFLADVAFAQQRIAVANQQLSSGLKIQVASDGPDVVSELLQLRANLQKNSQLTDNLGLAKTDADVADTSLNAATQLMDTALSLAAQGATATTTAADPSASRWCSASSQRIASAISASLTRKDDGVSSTLSKRCVRPTSAASPPARTSAMIERTVSATSGNVSRLAPVRRSNCASKSGARECRRRAIVMPSRDEGGRARPRRR